MKMWTQSVDGETAGNSAARRLSSKGRAKECGAVSRAFTLIELLVVIGIIVVLIGILLPTLGKAKKSARAAETRALMSHLSANLDGYFTRFHAYPGPFSSTQTTAGSNKLSGTQNMMLGLTYGFVPASPPPGAPPLPVGTGPQFGSFGRALSLTGNGPVDFSSVRPDGKYEQLGTFFEPIAKQVFDFASNQTLAGNTFRLPVVVDAFTDGLPILYYRRTVGSDNAVTANPPGYNYNENREYTNPSGGVLVSSSGTSFPQNSAGATFTPQDLNRIVSVDETTNGKVHGGYVLISAGVDRSFGMMTVNGQQQPRDDIFIVGGD